MTTTTLTREERNHLNNQMMNRAEKLWDSDKGEVLQAFFDDKITRRQVLRTRTVFMEGFKNITNIHHTADNWDAVVVESFRFSPLQKTVSVAVRFNRSDWKGTLAGSLCAVDGHFFIGERGAVEAKTYDKGNATKAAKSPLIYGWIH